MTDELFLKHAESIKKVNNFFIEEGIGTSHFLLLTEIVTRKIKGDDLPNIKWLQTELQISFTKVKAIVELLEKKSIIIKTKSSEDARVKFIDITEKGKKYIYQIIESLPVK